MGDFVSDSRIMALLASGMSFRRAADPSGVLQTASVRTLSYDRSGGLWRMSVVFPSGVELAFDGTLGDSLAVTGYRILTDDRKRVSSGVFPDVLSAFGDLSRLPSVLRSNLSVPQRGVLPVSDVSVLKGMFRLAADALFSGMEGGGSGDSYRRLFTCIVFRYSSGADGSVSSVSLQSSVDYGGGRVTVSAGVDLFGLNSKSVCLDYPFGLGRHMSSGCFLTVKGRTVPSLRLAFDLADRLSGLYAQQRGLKERKGTPAAVAAAPVVVPERKSPSGGCDPGKAVADLEDMESLRLQTAAAEQMLRSGRERGRGGVSAVKG